MTVVNNSDGETNVAIWTRGYFLNASAAQTGDDYVAPLSATGKLRLTNHGTGTVHISITTRGYFMAATADGEVGTQFTPTPATVILQTLDGTGVPGGSTAPLAAGSSITFNATGFASQDSGSVLAAALNVNVRRPTGSGYLTVYSAEEDDPGISSVVFTSDGDRSNGFDLVIPSSDGQVTIADHSGGTVHVEVSARGYFTVPASRIEHSDLPEIPIADESLVPVAGGSRSYNLRPKKYPWEKVQGSAEGTLWWYGSAPYDNYLKSEVYDNVPDGACIALVVRIDGKLYSNKSVRDCGVNNPSKRWSGWIRSGHSAAPAPRAAAGAQASGSKACPTVFLTPAASRMMPSNIG